MARNGLGENRLRIKTKSKKIPSGFLLRIASYTCVRNVKIFGEDFYKTRFEAKPPKCMDDAILSTKLLLYNILTVKHKSRPGNLNFSCRIV